MLVSSVLFPEDTGVPATLARLEVRAGLGMGESRTLSLPKLPSQKPSLCSPSTYGRPELGVHQGLQVGFQPSLWCLCLGGITVWFSLWL